MRTRILITALLTAGLSQAQNCDRACLKSTLDQYLAAVIKHDPAAAPLFITFRQTDNGVAVKPGAGTWQTVTGLGPVQRRYLDPVNGQAAYLGTIQEGNVTGAAGSGRVITRTPWRPS